MPAYYNPSSYVPLSLVAYSHHTIYISKSQITVATHTTQSLQPHTYSVYGYVVSRINEYNIVVHEYHYENINNYF